MDKDNADKSIINYIQIIIDDKIYLPTEQYKHTTQHKINKTKNDWVNLTAMTVSRSAHAVILCV